MDAISRMSRSVAALRSPMRAIALLGALSITPASAAERIQGQVLGAGAPIAGSTVTLYAASAGAPRQLGQVRTGADGRFAINASGTAGKDTALYLICLLYTSSVSITGCSSPLSSAS